MHSTRALLTCLSLISVNAFPFHLGGDGLFSNRVVFVPPATYTDPRVLYARTVELADGTLLSTWENYSPEPPPVYYPIFKSVDGGQHWKHFSNITDQVNGWGLRYQPFLYQLPEAIADFPAGTVLAAGNSIPTDLSETQIDLYASRDFGFTWEFVSHIAHGGEALPDNGLTPVWEPFLMLYQGEMICYYSDQRDNATHGQMLSHQTSRDLRTWGQVVVDVAYSEYTARPGMTTVTQLPNGEYMMTYEYGGAPGSSVYWFAVYYRINRDPRRFNDSIGYPISVNGFQPQSSPYITWTPEGGRNGTIVVSCGTASQIFTNQALGDIDSWMMWDTPQAVAYSRHLRVMHGNPDHLLIMGAGNLPPSTTNNVSLSVISLARTMDKW